MFAVPPPPSQDGPAARSDRSSRFTDLDSAAPAVATVQKSDSLAQFLWNNPTAVLTDHDRCFDLVAAAVLAGETVLCAAVVRYIPYTEIDFSTYLQQAQAFLDGERDYAMLKGESGPANYPALHIYLYSALSWLTDRGKHLERAQWAFAGVYLATLAVVLFGVYRRNRRIPPYVLPLLSISKRLHSIYMLRMFNDCVVMLLVYAALLLYMIPAPSISSSDPQAGRVAKRRVEQRWLLGTALLSCALSIKMSTLLFLPALFYLVFVHFSPLALLQHVLVLLTTQVLLAAPFLSTAEYRSRYLAQAFDFGRAFEWEFTVNWRWLGEEAFVNPSWPQFLLGAHAVGLLVWGSKWAEEDGGMERLLRRAVAKPTARPAMGKALASSRIATMFFCANLTGVVCARSLHPQFYAWFAHSLVWMCWGTSCAFEPMHCLVIISLVEYGFSVWPSTVNSSLGLVLSLVILLFGVYYGDSIRSNGTAPPTPAADRPEDIVVPPERSRRSDEKKRN
ncbi:hypothetical protein BMF94_4884 [Rhodotorula taiwanensis]|uniref:Dol-P-Man:Man(5)GlcNAc(2)-PP-Dol alpha-1,3-mannosyltransferase n=1 Tax=Rhodotorula taiwanensis TaxID=741276 RepID=A0A2S5B5M9_9BASI|nr:hypothetical protein BMF94_4884 [Rhodotorula taiwanensis]